MNTEMQTLVDELVKCQSIKVKYYCTKDALNEIIKTLHKAVEDHANSNDNKQLVSAINDVIRYASNVVGQVIKVGGENRTQG